MFCVSITLNQVMRTKTEMRSVQAEAEAEDGWLVVPIIELTWQKNEKLNPVIVAISTAKK